MRLPKPYNIYQHNEQAEKLFKLAYELNSKLDADAHVDDICQGNLALLKKMNAIIIHLELAIDEILKVEEKA